jgi:hypothetical protein
MMKRADFNIAVLSDAKPCACTKVPSFWKKALPLSSARKTQRYRPSHLRRL